MSTNNNQGKRGKKKGIKKDKIKQVQIKEDQEDKNELQGGFVDLVSVSELSSPMEEENLPEEEIKEDQNKVPKADKHEKKEIIWKNLPAGISKASSLMVIGQKNTGKSTLCSHLISNNPENYVLLDCDLGKNGCLEGCASLRHKEE